MTKSATLKIVYIGDSGVGKTSVNTKFITGKFNEYDCLPTVGSTFSLVNYIDYQRDLRLTINFWDTAGQEKYHSIVPMYYRGASIIIMTYDITNQVTFDHLVRRWAKAIEYESAFVKVVIGNKSDLSHLRQVDNEQARQWAEFEGFLFYETSAKTDDLSPIFKEIIGNASDHILNSTRNPARLHMGGVDLGGPSYATEIIDNEEFSCLC